MKRVKNKTITKEGLEKLLEIRGLLLKLLAKMENLKVVDVGSDYVMFSLCFYPCYKEICKFVEFIDDYLSNGAEK